MNGEHQSNRRNFFIECGQQIASRWNELVNTSVLSKVIPVANEKPPSNWFYLAQYSELYPGSRVQRQINQQDITVESNEYGVFAHRNYQYYYALELRNHNELHINLTLPWPATRRLSHINQQVQDYNGENNERQS